MPLSFPENRNMKTRRGRKRRLDRSLPSVFGTDSMAGALMKDPKVEDHGALGVKDLDKIVEPGLRLKRTGAKKNPGLSGCVLPGNVADL